MKPKIVTLGLVIISAVVFFAGCSKDKSGATAPEAAAALSITPVDQSQNVPLDQKVVLSFQQAVDTKTVEAGFHLISQKDMADSTCPVSQNMMHGDMNMAMMDTMKMNHLDQMHSIKGKFSWNSEKTQCTFTPDSMMNPNMTYMVHLGKNMMDMMNSTMSGMGNMSGSGMMGGMGSSTSGQMPGHMLMHFTTSQVISTTGTGSGHLGHH